MKPHFRTAIALITLAGVLVACSRPGDAPPKATLEAAPKAATPQSTTAPADSGIAWLQAASDADVDAAFAQAKAQGKPVFVYWGAKWCPPCNHVKATLFNRHDFIERSRAFVAVYVDGDRPGAQKLGTRFNVRGYPTMVLFNAQGAELTRLPGEVDAAQYTQVLTLGMNAQRPIKAVLADARAGGQGLMPGDWRLMAFYSWETDEQQLVAKPDVAALLKQLADACPADQRETAARLTLKALAALDEKSKPRPDARTRAKVLELLADAAQSRAHMDVLANNAADIARALGAAATPERAQVLLALDEALQRLAADATLSRADRMTAVIARVDLARIELPKDESARAKRVMPDALLAQVREHSARADREITDGYERQAVITTAAYMLAHAGLVGESDALLKANLAKSHSPYYLMSELASNAKKRGDKAEALRWYETAFEKSEGPATRLQWGASYVAALVDLAPHESARIERAVQQLFTEAAAQSDAFYERSARSLQRMGAKLQAWRNQDRARASVVKRLQTQLGAVCARIDPSDPQRATCDTLLKPGASKSI